MESQQLIEHGNALFRANLSRRSKVGRVSDLAMRAEITLRRKLGNPTHVVHCNKCHVYHPLYVDDNTYLQSGVMEFRNKHLNCGHFALEVPCPADAWYQDADGVWKQDIAPRGMYKSAVEVTSVPVWSADGWVPNSDVKQAFATETALTVTTLHSLASSATQGWLSGSVDNSTNLYLMALVAVHIAAVNTAPGSDKTLYVYAFGSTDGTIFTSTGAGASGFTTGTTGVQSTVAGNFPSISTLPCVAPMAGLIPYPVQFVPLDGGPFEIGRCFGGMLPKAWAVGILNFAGFTTAAAGNTVKHLQGYNTVI